MAQRKGFTLIELMVVIVILGVLAALIVPNLLSRPNEARIIAAKQDIATLMQSLHLYYLDNGVYPAEEQGLSALVSKPTTAPVPRNWKSGGYLDALPQDPWGHAYQYMNPGKHQVVDVYSFGENGAEATDDRAFIGSWHLS